MKSLAIHAMFELSRERGACERWTAPGSALVSNRERGLSHPVLRERFHLSHSNRSNLLFGSITAAAATAPAPAGFTLAETYAVVDIGGQQLVVEAGRWYTVNRLQVRNMFTLRWLGLGLSMLAVLAANITLLGLRPARLSSSRTCSIEPSMAICMASPPWNLVMGHCLARCHGRFPSSRRYLEGIVAVLRLGFLPT